jgi:hypothetical protein
LLLEIFGRAAEMTPERRKQRIKILSTALEEIESAFNWAGFEIPINSTDDDASEATSDDDDEEDDGDYLEDKVYDREDIEVAIDEFLSTLKNGGVIKKNKKGHLPSFSGALALVFGEDHDVVKKAKSFEEFIEGYFGNIFYEQMVSAFREFVEITNEVKSELDKC